MWLDLWLSRSALSHNNQYFGGATAVAAFTIRAIWNRRGIKRQELVIHMSLWI